MVFVFSFSFSSACAIARSLGIQRIFIHKLSSLLSAYGISLADVVQEHQEPSAFVYNDKDMTAVNKKIAYLKERCNRDLASQGYDPSLIETEGRHLSFFSFFFFLATKNPNSVMYYFRQLS